MSVEARNEIKQGAIKHLIRLVFQRVIGVCLFCIAAGTVSDTRGIVYIALYLLGSFIGIAIMFHGHKETLNAREQTRKSIKGWDKILLPIIWLLAFFVIYVIAGLGIRFEWSVLPIQWFYVGIAMFLVSSVFNTWSVMENKHFEGTSRIQTDREHTVITTGAYRIVRHPGYSSLVIWAIAVYLVFGTLAVGIVSFIVIGAVWIRTYLEDKMLKDELAGYLEYSQKTRYRLIPFIW